VRKMSQEEGGRTTCHDDLAMVRIVPQSRHLAKAVNSGDDEVQPADEHQDKNRCEDGRLGRSSIRPPGPKAAVARHSMLMIPRHSTHLAPEEFADYERGRDHDGRGCAP